MAQHDYVISNGTGAAVRSDLNNALLAIVSQNSGATEPTTTYAYQWWADTTTGLLKIRNSANNAWITLRELDGTLTVEDGTVSAPGLAFRDDLNTGIWRPGTDQFAISTNGVERVEWGTSEVVFNDGGTNYDFRVEGDNNANLLFVDASADAVGIGTSSVGDTLHVKGSSTYGGVIVDNSAATGGGAFRAYRNGVQKAIFCADSWVTGTSSDDAAIYADAGGGIKFYTNNSSTAKAVLTSGGSLGIGSNSPLSTLECRGQFSISNNATSYWVLDRDDSDGRLKLLDSSTSSNERLAVDASGRLLVGTSTSTNNLRLDAKLAVVSTGSGNFGGVNLTNYGGTSATTASFIDFNRSRGTTDGSFTSVASGDVLGYLVWRGATGSAWNDSAVIQAEVDGTPGATSAPGRLVFSTAASGASTASERLRITKEGWIQYGTATKNITTPNNPGFEILVQTTGGLGLYSNNTNNNITSVVFQNPNGRVGFIDINASSVNYSTTSDYRLKENVTPVIDGINRLQQLKPSRFNFIADPVNTVDGFLAHEVQMIVPEAITGKKDAVDDDGNPIYQGIDQSKLVPLLTAALQEAIGEIESLKARVAALESA